MNIILAIAAVTLLPSDGIVADRCDVIEINHYHGDNGKVIHTQVIFWDYADQGTREDVAAWRLWKNPTRMPTRNQFTGEWEVLFHDGQTMRHVTAANFRETWTQHDREMTSRRDLPKSQRRGLTERPEGTSSY